MIILGINISGYLSSACLFIDGELKFAITEERLSRIKRDKSFPVRSIEYCCENANISKYDINAIYVGWNPALYMYKSDNTLHDALKDRGKISHLVLNELSTLIYKEMIGIKHELITPNSNWKIHFVNHHHAHLSNAYFLSGFDKSDFFIADGFGEDSSGCVGTIDNKSIDTFDNFRTPHSLGSFYSTFTQFLGFNSNCDEWKVMALASLGDSNLYYDKIKNLIHVDNINFELNLSYFEHYLFFTPNYFSPKFVEAFGTPISQLDELTQYHYDMIASVQRIAEDVAIEILKNLQKKTKSKNVVLSGGFFMNSVLNGKILKMTPYDNIYIGGSPDDSGVSIGSALYGLFIDHNYQKCFDMMNHNYLGREYSDSEILNELSKRKIKYKIVKDIAKFAAKKIRDKNIVGWFQGKSEFGQRALGNRSILADPTQDDIKDKINSSVKYREIFRPFAPSILKEKQDDYFIIPKNQDSFFMEKVFMFKDEYKSKLPGVVHFDGSGRIQTVSKNINSKYYSVIKEFEKLSGFPILLNTSLNINGMPLAETPADAIDCFYQSGIDYLILHNIVIKK